jgi:hypothetical protein
MIPKIIHYCWFGKGAMPNLALECINSWKQHLSDYELRLWNEDNFDVNSTHFTKEAYEAQKYAFITDYVRLHALKKYGGIYMDTDVEVIKNLDNFLSLSAFAGFEDHKNISTALMASEKNGKWVEELLEYYNNRHFILPNGKLDTKPNVAIISKHMINKGFIPNNQHQEINEMVTFFPQDFFCAKSLITGRIIATENTHTIHHFVASWITPYQKFQKRIKHLLGKAGLYQIARFVYDKIKNK